jgi:ubiquinone/menaquinone biosynthesis C-methylase UbiE
LLLVTPGAALHIDEATVDKACTVATMYAIEDPAVVFAEMYRVLKSGGLGAVTFPVRRHTLSHELAMAVRQLASLTCSPQTAQNLQLGVRQDV